jgi:hypothetical protein
MPLNLCGGGVPETNEFRVTFSAMQMEMEGMRTGMTDVDASRSLNIFDLMGASSASPHAGHSHTGASSQDATILQDHINGLLTGRKYMEVPTYMRMSMTHVMFGYSFTDNLYGMLMFVGKKNAMGMKVSPMMVSMYGKSNYEMKSEGMGDTEMILKYRIYANDPLIPTNQMSISFGMSMPTGSINERNSASPFGGDPYTITTGQNLIKANHADINYKLELLPYDMQLGSGTWDPIVGFAYGGSASPWWWGTNLKFIGREYRNARGWAYGDEFQYSAYLMRQLAYDWVAQIQLNGRSWGKIQGEADEVRTGLSGRNVQGNPWSDYMMPSWNPNYYGGERVDATVGLQWQPIPLHVVELDISAPVYERLNGMQMSGEYTVQLSYFVEIPTPSSARYSGKKGESESNLGF